MRHVKLWIDVTYTIGNDDTREYSLGHKVVTTLRELNRYVVAKGTYSLVTARVTR